MCLAGGSHCICSAGGFKVGVLKRNQNIGAIERKRIQTWNTGGRKQKKTSSSSFCFSFFRRSSWPCQRKPQTMVILPMALTNRLTCTPYGSWYVLNLSPSLQNTADFHGNGKGTYWKSCWKFQDVQNSPCTLRPDLKEKQWHHFVKKTKEDAW